MNKITLFLASIAFCFSVFTFFYYNSFNELVYVDVNKLMEGYKGTPLEKAKLDLKVKSLQSNIDSLVSNWQTELKIYEKERTSMTQKELELKQELLRNKQQQINNYQQAIEKQIQEEDQKASQNVINEINDYIEEYGENHRYDIIFGANGAGNIVYANKSTDITQEVLEGLNEQFKRDE